MKQTKTVYSCNLCLQVITEDPLGGMGLAMTEVEGFAPKYRFVTLGDSLTHVCDNCELRLSMMYRERGKS